MRSPAGDPPSPLDAAHPGFDGYRGWLRRLPGRGIPGPAELCDLLPAGVTSGGGKPLRFVPASARPGVPYEAHIFETGEVPTREDDWHDLFNALAWCRWPRLKAALNAAHYRRLDDDVGGRRGPRRDALTLLDESGALVLSAQGGLLGALAARDWDGAFRGHADGWRRSTRVLVVGHAQLDKLRAPYKAATAQALLLEVGPGADLQGSDALSRIDAALAEAIAGGTLCRATTDLSPLPLAGIPGWWPGAQDAAFYADRTVFRPPRAGLATALLHRLGLSAVDGVVSPLPGDPAPA